MKICLNVNAESISTLALNMGKIAVEVDGVELAELIDAVNANDCTLRIADEPGMFTSFRRCPYGNIKRSPVQYCTYHQRGYREC